MGFGEYNVYFYKMNYQGPHSFRQSYLDMFNNVLNARQVDQVDRGNQVYQLDHVHQMVRGDPLDQRGRLDRVHQMDQLARMDPLDQVDRLQHQWLLADNIHTLYINLQWMMYWPFPDRNGVCNCTTKLGEIRRICRYIKRRLTSND